MNAPPLFPAFSTPISSGPLGFDAEARGQLKNRLVVASKTLPGAPRSDVNAWHSPPDLATHREGQWGVLWDGILQRGQALLQSIMTPRPELPTPRLRLGLQAWAIVAEAGGYMTPHDHAQATLSGVYYVSAGDRPDAHPKSGQLVFLHPQSALPQVAGGYLFPSELALDPKDDLLVMFPGYLRHYVHPYQGTSPRVAISFNLSATVLPG